VVARNDDACGNGWPPGIGPGSRGLSSLSKRLGAIVLHVGITSSCHAKGWELPAPWNRAGSKGWAVAAAVALWFLSGAPVAAYPFNEFGGWGGGGGGYPLNDGGLYFRDRPYLSDRPAYAPASRPARRRHDTAKTTEPKAQKLSGPLILAVSVGSQHVTVYDNGVPVASAPVSTGMNGHPTPLGVFSVIQKEKWHESNLYSNAPMPYMQRITWSGIALHAGVLPGYRASHGCIRLPYEFAVRLWGMTRIGARVVVTRNDVPVFEINHPRLAALLQKPSDAAPSTTPPPDTKASDEKISPASADAPAAAVPARAATVEPWVAGLRPALAVSGTQVPPLRTPSKPSGPAPATAADPSPGVAQPVQPVQPVQPSTEPVLRPGPISLFVSRKEGKLFVRKGFEPVFDMPVRIEHPEAPIGTHVFTAGRPAEGETGLRWFAVSIPNDRDAQPEPKSKSRAAREQRVVAFAEPPRRSAADALDRVELPPEALERVAPLMTPGASLVIADQGLGVETGKETDFIVVTR
jgi:lipoprotein-anchoring transpeptidase ErfK/SrfK